MKRLIFLAALVASVGHAQTVPRIEFKGLSFGASIEQVKRMYPLACRQNTSRLSDVKCFIDRDEHWTYAGRRIEEMNIHFIAGKLDSVMLVMQEDVFDSIEAAFVARYGAGQCKRSAPSFCEWKIAGDVATLFNSQRSYATVVMLESGAGEQERATRRKAYEARQKRDL